MGHAARRTKTITEMVDRELERRQISKRSPTRWVIGHPRVMRALLVLAWPLYFVLWRGRDWRIDFDLVNALIPKK